MRTTPRSSVARVLIVASLTGFLTAGCGSGESLSTRCDTYGAKWAHLYTEPLGSPQATTDGLATSATNLCLAQAAKMGLGSSITTAQGDALIESLTAGTSITWTQVS
jgi:hypothetical protein